jgi:hypothetical protein
MNSLLAFGPHEITAAAGISNPPAVGSFVRPIRELAGEKRC